jgi:hypothetical protein
MIYYTVVKEKDLVQKEILIKDEENVQTKLWFELLLQSYIVHEFTVT